MFAVKLLLCLLGAGVFAGCTVQPELTVVREHDAAGVPTDNYRVLTTSGYTQSRGHLIAGKMDGLWTFFDSSIRVAEVTYQMGAFTGPYRTYFGGVAFPASAGKLQSEGRLEDGRLAGSYRVYDRLTGRVESEAIFGSVYADVEAMANRRDGGG